MFNSRSRLNVFRDWALITGLAATAMPALAAQPNQSTATSATLVASCTSVSATPLNFGRHVQQAGQVYPAANDSANGTFTVTAVCGVGAPYSISTDVGLYPTGNVRQMKRINPSSADFLAYRLYKNVGRSQMLGPVGGASGGFGTPDNSGYTGTGASEQYIYYGQFDYGFTSPPGDYQDTLTVYLNF